MSGIAELFKESYLNGGTAAYIEELYEQFLEDPNSVSDNWQAIFREMRQGAVDYAHEPVKAYFREAWRRQPVAVVRGEINAEHETKQDSVLRLINAYRSRGHQHANLDPLGLWKQEQVPDLSLEYHGLSERDFGTVFRSNLYGPTERTLGDIYQHLIDCYCSSVGLESSHIVNQNEKVWLREYIEKARCQPQMRDDSKETLLAGLTAAEGLERYLGTKFPGAKRFSLEGGDSFVPMMHEMISRAGEQGVKEIVIGMAHRGRLNVLVNVLGKKPANLFDEFAGRHVTHTGSGDVKYHMGFSSDYETPGGSVHLALAFNPSHLEIVTPVIEGSVRARQNRRNDETRLQVLPIAIHGDSAFIGQGVVMETFNMSQTRGYNTGGTVHIVINNQVGFTTSKQEDVRSTVYCTDIAKMVQAPVLHVNADDAEAVMFTTQLALDYRMKFQKDVVIDLVCYRRWGHNEADEPTATQPVMYKVIKARPTARQLYAEKLMKEGVLDEDKVKKIADDYRDKLDAGEQVVPHIVTGLKHPFSTDWTPYMGQKWTAAADTSIDEERVARLGEVLTTVPEGFTMQSRVAKIIEDRRKMFKGEVDFDWGCAETLAYATLLEEGFRVRISGQDCGRGTFFHRHAVWHEQHTGETYIPLKNISKDQAHFNVIDSVLSEEAVLAFEYGYATTEPRALVIWEAQFGDFANGAQVVIDQFISSGEQKWGRLCGMTLLLPHGYEGQGPEHSSARLERFLQLCAEQNMQVVVPTTPAQVFHMLRRQMIRPMRRPLIVMSPKSLLRHKLAVSNMDEIVNGKFKTVIGEIDNINPKKVKRVVLCSGKVYYDLLEQRREDKREDVAIIRIEQLYPFPTSGLKKVLEDYAHVKEFVWCQEEPKNQGAWYSSKHHFKECFPAGFTLSFAGRPASAAPAVGYASLHDKQQKALVAKALG
ncbi:2-oxoglutarate dehydrogenase E1 component [Permianibacter aggregans]|uniref:2-oxoglutarate dehydrogenase E1 component n=1 Tax=Permianibacter aggregans TaxID=1510150 RepID=A0A4R6UQK8_9GAMM|nr:2-oxoglutarate dehydrogenase E1 component [Permianibacter aggregans]QGX38430.1 2-oxoglutarate dehydrogenase E1 component [Permianibacter aggregans]TDQ45544.1 2-oxoglutarate dehydrogenase E1 component [Permianibacter aggregans]